MELIKGMRQVPHVEFMVLSMGEEDFYLSQLQELGVSVHFLIRSLRWDILFFARLLRVLQEYKPDIIHTNSDMATFYALPLAKPLRIKVINGSIRNAFSGKGVRWALHKFLLWWSDARVANSKAGFASRGMSYNAKGNFVIYNGFDIQRFDKKIGSDGIPGIPWGRSRVVGMVAECSDYKDFGTFVQAARVISKIRDDVLFVAIGGGKNYPDLRRMTEAEDRHIRFLGERKDVDDLIRSFDVGVLCTFSEGISNSVMEYMAAQKPVVVTDAGGSRELVDQGVHGFLVPQSDAKALADKILLLLDDRRLSEKMGAVGRKKIVDDFSMEQLIDRNIEMYNNIRGARSSGLG